MSKERGTLYGKHITTFSVFMLDGLAALRLQGILYRRSPDRSMSQKISLIIMDSVYFPYAEAFGQALKELDVQVEVVRIPHFHVEELTIGRLRRLKSLLREKSREGLLMFCPGSAEFYMTEADRIFVFSSYKRWHQSEKFRIIPHIWTAVKLRKSIEQLKWANKPPLRIGFMGTSYATARLANVVLRCPHWIKRWLLGGYYLKAPEVIALSNQMGFPLKYLNTFPRYETLKTLREKKPGSGDVELEIVELPGFGGTEFE